jgi:hypothetical protein
MENKQWIFSGIGLFLLSSVFYGIKYFRNRLNSPRADLESGSQAHHKSSNFALEEAICKKAKADFQVFIREFNASPISDTQLAEIEEQIKGDYSPFNVLVSSLDIRIKHYILPIVSELIKIESDLRNKHHVPYSQARITSIRDKIRTLVKENWSNIVYMAYEDAIEHVVHHVGTLHQHKKTELGDLRDRLLKENPDALFIIIDELLQKAFADSII